jgi:hypothetical protein
MFYTSDAPAGKEPIGSRPEADLVERPARRMTGILTVQDGSDATAARR